MTYHVDSLLKDRMQKYSMKLWTKQAGLSNPVDWMYVAEDMENINFIKENELIITTGLFTVRGTALLDFISAMIDRKTAGIIMNTGKYIMEDDITDDMIGLCEKNKIPLITMPWEISIADVMQEFCGLLFKKKNQKDMLTEALEYVIGKKKKREKYKEILKQHHFLDSSEYVIICLEQNADSSQIKTALSTFCKNFHLMEYEDHWIAVMADPVKREAGMEHKLPCRAGISLAKRGFFSLSELYRQAKDALRASRLLEKDTCFYGDIGVLEILFAVKEETILKEFAEKRLGKLEEYDRKHPLDLINTLFYYLKTDGSLTDAAEILFLHRNTIGYRMNKIKEISGADFDTAEERYEYLTAVYIRKMGIV